MMSAEPPPKQPEIPVAALDALYAKAGMTASEFYLERAGIYEYDGGQSRLEASNRAHRDTVEMLHRQIAEGTQRIIESNREISRIEKKWRNSGTNENEIMRHIALNYDPEFPEWSSADKKMIKVKVDFCNYIISLENPIPEMKKSCNAFIECAIRKGWI